MAFSTAADIAVQVIVRQSETDSTPIVAAERRITPSWTIEQLKSKLEPVTGIPSGAQRLKTRRIDGGWIFLEPDEASVSDGRWSLRKGSEIEVTDTRPPGSRQNFTDVSLVEKYQMPEEQYEQLSDSVLAWKRRQKLGRFDPNAKSVDELAVERKQKDELEVSTKSIKVGVRCRVGRDDNRRGVVKSVGPIYGLGGVKEVGCVWVGVELDEPVGKNDGSVHVETDEGKQQLRRVFQCQDKYGVFARPEKVEVGNWPPLDDLEIDEDMEEM